MTNTISHSDLRVQITYRQIFSMAIPISFGILVPQLNFITNNIFLGRLGEQALATAAITGVYYLIFGSIGFALNNGLQALISRRAGENRPGEIGKIFTQGVGISLLIALVGILLTYTLAPALLRISIHNEAIREQATRFLKIRIWGLPFLYIYQMRNALLVGTNQSRYLVAGTLAEAISNIFFDYSFIFGHFGFPKMGFDGAAYASIIAELLGMLVVFAVIHFKGIGRRFSLFSQLRYDSKIARSILSLSGPIMFQHAISIVSWQIFYILIEHHGARALSISNTMRNLFGLFGMFSWAFSATCNSMVSNIIGQGLQDRVEELIHKIVRVSTGISLLVFALLNLFPTSFLGIYGQGPEWIQAAIPVVRIVSVALVMMSFSVVWLSAVTGTGNAKVNLMIEAVTITLYCFYIWYVLEIRNSSLIVGWMSEWLYWASMFTLSFLYIRSGRWKGKII
jgi:multidrug resistance protein, MATE family